MNLCLVDARLERLMQVAGHGLRVFVGSWLLLQGLALRHMQADA